MANMLINRDWDFEFAVKEVSKECYLGGDAVGRLRSREVEAWGLLVGKSRALAEFDAAIKRYGSLSAFGRQYRVTLPTLHAFREFFENLPDDQAVNAITGNRVFISYAREDQSVALEIYDLLKSNGCSPWIDFHNLKPGQDWKLEIDKAIQSSNYFVACLSSNSVSKRGYVQKELKSALSVLDLIPEGTIYLLPVRLDECAIPHSLSG